jgi:translation initiation factor IF-1
MIKNVINDIFIKMKKKIIKLTEADLRNIVMRVINEQFDSDYYDIILDLYNEVGLEGMTDEEIEYLKSGGESNVPERFLGGDLDIDDEESEDMGGLDRFKEVMDGFNHKVVDTAPDGKLRVVFKDRPEIMERLEGVVPESSIEVRQGYIVVVVPENWTDDIFGEEI